MEKFFERAIETGRAPTITDRIKARVLTVAADLSLAGTLQAHLDIATSAIQALIGILYDQDSDGVFANFDYATGRILIPTPWTATGFQHYGLRQWESRCLRRLLIERSTQARRLPPLFDYNAMMRTWHVNHQAYADTTAALAWLRKDGPSLTEWRTIVCVYRDNAADQKRQWRERTLNER